MSNSLTGSNSIESVQLRNLLRLMLRKNVFKFGEFTLKSGQKSPIYIDLRESFGYADIMELACSGLRDMIVKNPQPFDGIVGVPYAALPYSTIVSQLIRKPLIIIRKEAKSYGTKKLIEGLYERGQTVVIIEDVVTTGGSIKEVVTTLRAEGLVVEDVYCLLDREQGGAARLAEDGIRLHSLLNMEKILSFMVAVNAIDAEKWKQIVAALSLPFSEMKHIEMGSALEEIPSINGNGNIMQSKREMPARIPLSERADITTNKLNKKLIPLMLKKASNLCLAIDYTDSAKILELATLAGPFVIAVKIHADIITDFSKKFTDSLVRLANDHEFVIFEDRKFGDTGNTVSLQLAGYHRISDWADLVTCHGVQGAESISNTFRKVILDETSRLSGILLISQLSTKGSLTEPVYANHVALIGEQNADVVCGFICQDRATGQAGILNWTPGVNLDKNSDGAGQQWRGVDEAITEQQNDIIIVGRAITESAHPVQELKRYREAAWAALTKQ